MVLLGDLVRVSVYSAQRDAISYACTPCCSLRLRPTKCIVQDEEKEKAMAERKRPLNELVGDGVVPGSSGDGTLGGDSTAQPMPRPAALSGARLQSIRSAIAIQEDPIS